MTCNWFEPELVYQEIYRKERSDEERFLHLARLRHQSMIEDTVEQFAIWICDYAEGETVWLEFIPELRIVSSPDLLDADEEGDPYVDGRGAPIQFYSATFTTWLVEALYRCEPSSDPIMKIRNADRYCKRGELVVMALLYLAYGEAPVWDHAAARDWFQAQQTPQLTLFA